MCCAVLCCGMLWSGMVCCGVVWYDVLWYVIKNLLLPVLVAVSLFEDVGIYKLNIRQIREDLCEQSLQRVEQLWY